MLQTCLWFWHKTGKLSGCLKLLEVFSANLGTRLLFYTGSQPLALLLCIFKFNIQPESHWSGSLDHLWKWLLGTIGQCLFFLSCLPSSCHPADFCSVPCFLCHGFFLTKVGLVALYINIILSNSCKNRFSTSTLHFGIQIFSPFSVLPLYKCYIQVYLLLCL